jgi:CBS domain-containing protein
VQAAGREECVVLNDARIVLGYLGSDGFEAAPETIVEQVMEPGPATIRPHVSLTEITEYMQKKHIDKILVTTADGELVGLLYRQDAEQMRG